MVRHDLINKEIISRFTIKSSRQNSTNKSMVIITTNFNIRLISTLFFNMLLKSM